MAKNKPDDDNIAMDYVRMELRFLLPLFNNRAAKTTSAAPAPESKYSSPGIPGRVPPTTLQSPGPVKVPAEAPVQKASARSIPKPPS
jgi:hypothetical protein